MRRVILSFTWVALSVASAATYQVSLVEPSVVKGKALKTGDYVLVVKENSVVILKNDKPQIEVPVKTQDTNRKFDRTHILYNLERGRFTIKEIELGGTTTKLVIDNDTPASGGE